MEQVILDGMKKGECKVDITLPEKEVKDGDILFNGEYLITSFFCKDVEENAIKHIDFNFYVDGELWGSNEAF